MGVGAGGDSGERAILVNSLGNNLGVFSTNAFFDSQYDLRVSNVWRHIMAVGSGTTTVFYINGTLGGTSYYRATNDIRYIGNYTNAERFAENMDEMRIGLAARSVDWAWASWLSQASNGAFAGYTVVPWPAGGETDARGICPRRRRARCDLART